MVKIFGQASGSPRLPEGCRHSIIIIVTLAQRALCRLLHLRPVDTAASADEFVVLLQAIAELLHAYDAIEEESGDVEHRTISLLLARRMSAREIKWPDSNDIARSKRAFRALYQRQGVEAGIPDVIGALDGYHIRISRPSESKESY
ncbi:hypothetical protein HPB52_021891 [Rhipicephalus sanguineus]|uniref:Uncharacterized protein n=1 Tax=Rhipicephalus sanguineus TaxID=34632 RepID=A0A9D4SXV4_RHISA|nr:hypothetical protein HPB52_021891 [Rhipicephalus sanguineus]